MSLLSAEENFQNAARFVEDLHSQRKRAAKRFLLLYALLVLAGAGWLVFALTQVTQANKAVSDAKDELATVEGKLKGQSTRAIELDAALLKKTKALEDKNKDLKDLNKLFNEKKARLGQIEEALEQYNEPSSGATPLETLRKLDNIVFLEGSQAAYDLWKQGYARFNAGDKDGAMRLYERSIEEAPAYAPPYNSIGRIYYGNKDYAQAEAWCNRALAKRPNYAPAQHNLALISNARGKPELACKWSKSALASRPGYKLAKEFFRRHNCAT